MEAKRVARFVLFVIAQLMWASVLSAQTQVLFEDRFDKNLGQGWQWLRENAANWRINDGGLEIRVEPGKADTVKNALLRPAPDRSKSDFAVEVTMTFTRDPTQQYEQGGITWYHNQKPVMKLVHEHIDGEDWIIPGRVPARSKTVQLRLIVKGTEWIAQFREALDDEFQTAASGQLPPPGDDQVSIQCYEGPSEGQHWIRFDNFRILEL